jgi:hypothetical protein
MEIASKSNTSIRTQKLDRSHMVTDLKKAHIFAQTGLSETMQRIIRLAQKSIIKEAGAGAQDEPEKRKREIVAMLGMRRYVEIITARYHALDVKDRKARQGEASIADHLWYGDLSLPPIIAHFIDVAHKQSWTDAAQVAALEWTEERHSIPAKEEGDNPYRWPYLVLLLNQSSMAAFGKLGISPRTVRRWVAHLVEQRVWLKLPICKRTGRSGTRYIYGVGYLATYGDDRKRGILFLKESTVVKRALRSLSELTIK